MATKATSISVTELQKREKTKKPASAIGKPAGTRPVSSKSTPSGSAMKPADPKAAAPVATGKTRLPTREQQEAERKKKLEEKRLKDKEKVEAMAEKRKAMEEKRKQELAEKLAKGKPTSATSRPVSGTSKTAASTKPGPRPTVTKIPVGKKPVEATDSPKPKSAGDVSKKPASRDAAATATQIPNGTASATAKKPRASTTPTTTTASKPLRAKPGSAGTTPTTRPALSRPAASKAASTPLSSKPDSTIPKPQKAAVKTSPLASARTTTSAPARASRAGASSAGSPVKSRVGATSVPSSAKKDGATTGIPVSRVSKPSSARPSPKQTASTPGAAKTPTKISVKAPTATTTTTTITTTNSAIKKGTTSKSPGRVPVKSTTPGKISSARPASGAGAKAPSGPPTKKTPFTKQSPLGAGKKLQPKATGSKIEKKAAVGEKKPAEKKTAVAEEKPVENEAVESNGLAEKNDVPQVVGTLATPEGADHNGPHPETVDATLPAFTPATAERVGQIISSQTSLSKELQSKLPRLGEAIGNENAQTSTDEVEIASQSDLQDTGTVDVAAVAVATISTDVKDLPEEFSAEWKVEKERKEQEEEAERDERSKRVDEIMDRTRAEATQMDLVEGKVRRSTSLTEQEVADAPPPSSTLPVSGDLQEHSPSPTLPIIPDSGAGEALPEPDIERGTVSAQDSFEFSPAPPQSQPPSVEPLTEGTEVTEEPVRMPEVPSVELEPEPLPVQVPEPSEEPKIIAEPELESPPVSVPTPSEEPAGTELEPVAPLIEVPMPSEPETLKPEPEATLVEVPVPSEEPKDAEIEHEAPPTQVPLPNEVPDIPGGELEPELEIPSISSDEPVIPAQDLEQAPTEQEEEIDAMAREINQPSPVDGEGGRDLAEELVEAEERVKSDSAVFEEEDTTSDVLAMLPEDTEKEMRQMIDDAAQRIRAIEEQNEFDNTQGSESQLVPSSDADVAPPLPSVPPPDLLSSDFTEGSQVGPAITSEVPVADLFDVSMDPFAVKEPAQTSDARTDDPFSMGELSGKEAPLGDPFSVEEPAIISAVPVMDPLSVGNSTDATGSDPFDSTDQQPVLLSGDMKDDSAPAQGPGLDVDLLGGLGGDSAPPPFGSVEPSPFGVDLLGLSEPAPQDKPAVLVDNTAPLDLFGLCAAPEPTEVQPLSFGGDLLGEPLLSTEAPPPHPPISEGDLMGQEDQVPTLAPEVQFEAERSPPSEGDLPNDVTPEPSAEEDVLSPSPPVPGATPPLPDSPPPLSSPVEGLPSPSVESPADDDVPISPIVDDDPSPPPLPADAPPLSPTVDDPSPSPLPGDAPQLPPTDDSPSPPPLPADDPPSPPSPSPPPLPVDDEPPSPPTDDDPLPPPLPADGPPADEDFPPEVELQPADSPPVVTTSPPLVETDNNFGQSVVSSEEENESS